MKLSGEHRFQIPREQVWDALLDVDVLSRCLPGFERLEKVGDNDFEGALNIRVGPVQGKFQGRLSLSDLDPPAGYNLKIKGQGPAGFVNGQGVLHLDDHGTETLLRYEMDAQVGGKIAGVGQRLLDSSARALSDQALGELGKIVQLLADTPETESADLPEAPSQKEFAAKVAKDVAADLIPPDRRALIVALTVTAVIVVVVLLFRSCGS